MKWKILNQRARLNLISAIILLVGLSSAILIYTSAQNDSYGVLGYEGSDRTIYPIMPENSKLYRHNLELFGGKFNVIMDDFRRWFIGLWHGKSLAFIVGCTAMLISFGVYYAANYLIPRLKTDAIHENNRERDRLE
jgi:hypothetical protein